MNRKKLVTLSPFFLALKKSVTPRPRAPQVPLNPPCEGHAALSRRGWERVDSWVFRRAPQVVGFFQNFPTKTIQIK